MLGEECSILWHHFLPTATDCGHCLIVTQSSVLPCWLQHRISCTIEVPPLTTEMSLSLFQGILHQAADHSTAEPLLKRLTPDAESQVRDLVADKGILSGVPVAVKLAAAFVRRHCLSNCDSGESSNLEVLSALSQALLWDNSVNPVSVPTADHHNYVEKDIGSPQTPGQHADCPVPRLLRTTLRYLSTAAQQLCLLLHH